MAMTSGGLIVHGVDKDLNITGCPLSQRTQDRITRFANECDVPVEVRAISVGDIELTVTEVPEITGRIVTTPDGRLLRRVGGDSQPLRNDAFSRFVMAHSGHSAEEAALDDFEPDDFDLQMVNKALIADGKRSTRRSETSQALVDLGVALPGSSSQKAVALQAAAVLFAKDPARHVGGARVQLVRRSGVGPGPGPSKARKEISGPLIAVVGQCLGFIAGHTQQYEAVTGVFREAVPEYPVEALREAIVNALAHRDYGLVGATVDVTIWDDRVEIKSPGPLPGHITVDNMRDDHFSRNHRIMKILKTMEVVEEHGEGINRMFQEMESRLLGPPIFEATPSSVTVTLRNHSLVSVEDQVWLRFFTDHQITFEERRALVAAHHEGSVTPRRLRELMPEVDITALLAGATAKGLLIREGTRGGSRYALSAEVLMRAGSAGILARNRQQQTLLDEINRLGSISTAEAADLLGEDSRIVRNLLNDLVQTGLARAEGQTRGRRYFPAD
ncbi:MAG: hypothetical protein OXG67_13265 [bacterium]|nr:hypothetical protein [bacterium]